MSTWFARGAGVGVVTLVVTLALLGAGCADGVDPSPPASDAGTPGTDVTVVTSPPSGGSFENAVAAYVTETGLDGETLEMTSPVSCAAFMGPTDRGGQAGRVCIDFPTGKFDKTTGSIEVLINRTERTWRITLELQNLAWVVKGSEYNGE